MSKFYTRQIFQNKFYWAADGDIYASTAHNNNNPESSIGLFNSIVDQKSPTDSLDKFAKEIVPISQKVTVIVKLLFSNSIDKR